MFSATTSDCFKRSKKMALPLSRFRLRVMLRLLQLRMMK